MPGRALLVLVAVAALLGAPSSVLAADEARRIRPGDTLDAAEIDEATTEPHAAGGALDLVLAAGVLGAAGVALVASATLRTARMRRVQARPEPALGVDPVALERRAQRRRRERPGDATIPATIGITNPRRRPPNARSRGGRARGRRPR